VLGPGNHDRELYARAEIVAEQPTAEAYVELARTLRDLAHLHDDDSTSDPTAALAACQAGLARFPGDASLLAAAAEHAQALGRIDQPIALLEAAIQVGGGVDEVFALRLGRLYAERIDRLAAGGRPGAAAAAWHDLDRSSRVADRAHPQPAWQAAVGGAQAALGKGLIADGELADGERTLTASIARAPSIDAFETLAELDLQVDHYAAATQWVARGVAMLGDTPSDRYHRAKLLRVSGDAFRRANRGRDAAEHYLEALRTWASLGSCDALPRAVCAERMLESGRIEYELGEPGRGVELVERAVDTDPDTPSTVAGAVAFLVEVDRAGDAAEAFHRGLGSTDVGELTKVYASLWMIGDARRRGTAPDRLAADYLASRRGDVWYDLLAEAASGHLDVAALRAAATTGPRRAELDFYTATLGLDPSARADELLARVVGQRLVTHAEYDLSRAYLAASPSR
jgi:tetratricopeptide (TPR) repeat protein